MFLDLEPYVDQLLSIIVITYGHRQFERLQVLSFVFEKSIRDVDFKQM